MRWYFTGLVLTFFGTTAMLLVAGVWVKSLTGSDSLATLAMFCFFAPGVLSPWLGRLADSYRRRPLLIWTDLAMVPVLAVLLVTENVWAIFAVMLVYGSKAVLVSAAEPAALARTTAWLPAVLAAGAVLVANISFAAIYVIIAVITTAMAIWTRGGRTRRFTARQTPAWRTADQME